MMLQLVLKTRQPDCYVGERISTDIDRSSEDRFHRVDIRHDGGIIFDRTFKE